MVKKYSLGLIFFFLTFTLASMEYEEFIDIILKNNKEYQKALSKYKISRIAIYNSKYDWIPKLELNFNYHSTIKSKNKTHYFQSGISFLQNLPMDMYFNIIFDNIFVYSQIENVENQYNIGSKLSFSMPLYFFSPALIEPYGRSQIFVKKNSLRTADLKLKKIREKIIADAIYIVCLYAIRRKILEIKEARILIDNQIAKNDEVLWKQGKISTLELSEKETKRYNSKILLLNFRNEYLKILQRLKLIGFDEKFNIDNIEVWMTKFEEHIKYKNFNDESLLIKKNELKMRKYNNLKKEMSKIPRLRVYFDFKPNSYSKGGIGFNDTIKNYWDSKKSWDFDISFDIKIPLSPLDEIYQINERTKEILKINKLNEQIIEAEYKNKKTNYQMNTKFLKEKYKLAKEKQENILNRLSFSETLLQYGYITSIDLKIQNLDYQIAKLQSLEARLDYIVAKFLPYF